VESIDPRAVEAPENTILTFPNKPGRELVIYIRIVK